MTVIKFLLARIAEDEDALPWLGDEVETIGGRLVNYRERVLADCEAKRRIVDLHDVVHECEGPNLVADPEREDWSDGYGGPCYTLMALALPYADHPDYRKEWRP